MEQLCSGLSEEDLEVSHSLTARLSIDQIASLIACKHIVIHKLLHRCCQEASKFSPGNGVSWDAM